MSSNTSDGEHKSATLSFEAGASPFLRYRFPRQSSELESVVQQDASSLNASLYSDTPMMIDHSRRNHAPAQGCSTSGGEELGLDFAGNQVLFSNIFASTRSAAHLLGELLSTALCGNDITSSCLYTAAFVAKSAAVYSFISLLLVAFVLYFFRFVYEELGDALPLNWGSYTIFLNTSQKWLASFAGSCSFLSYVATAVVSVATAISYGSALWGSGVDATALTIALLAVFCLLTLLGLTESATVAVVIFVLHVISLTALIVACFVFLCMNPHVIQENWRSSEAVPSQYNVVEGILIGFGAGMLGITGFETSCNFLEEQKPGVFPKTLRNMWICVLLFNPLISFFAYGVLTNDEVANASGALLADMALRVTGGNRIFFVIICVDAFLVLCGAVLTGYVGVVGLLGRLAEDRCIPVVLAAKNSLTVTRTFSILLFFGICASMVYIVGGVENLAILEGVYAVAFLMVMTLVAIGNMLLKYCRSYIPRCTTCSLRTAVFAACCTSAALLINVIVAPSVLYYFLIYLSFCAVCLFIMFQRLRMLKIFQFILCLALSQVRLWGLHFEN
eukprot:ANDGO_06864.mRNA.1 hypothetical protein DICPUDRAFT_55909